MTLNKYLQDNGINLTRDHKIQIGWRLVTSMKGLNLEIKKVPIVEDGEDMMVVDYPFEFEKYMQKIILNYIKTSYKK